MAESTNFLPPVSYDAGEFVIRAYLAGDGAALRDAVTSSYTHLSPWMAWSNAEQTLEESEAICRRLASAYMGGTDFSMGVWDGSELIGGTGFHLRCGPVDWRCAEIGMWIRTSRSGQGLGTRVLAAMLAWGFADWGWERIVWKCDTENLASERVAVKNEMNLEATFRSSAIGVDGLRKDMHLYVMLREEWLAIARGISA